MACVKGSNKNGAAVTTTVKNELLTGLFHENFYLVGREPTFDGEEITPGTG